MFTKEKKPHSSITQLVDLLTGQDHAKESYDDLPELASSISLQSTGPAEASRALRKKIKRGNSHQKYRALFPNAWTINLLMRSSNSPLIPSTDSEVRGKLAKVLSSWSVQYRGNASLSHVASLYTQCDDLHRSSQHGAATKRAEVDKMLQNAWLTSDSTEQKKKDKEAKEAKEAAKRKAKQEKAEAKHKAEEEARRSKDRPRRRFDFDKEKPQIINSIANASQASSNLINAMKLVNPDEESVATNSHVKDRVEMAKAARKSIVRYIQLVENEEMIGTLIAANEQVIAAIQLYDDVRLFTISHLANGELTWGPIACYGSSAFKGQFCQHPVRGASSHEHDRSNSVVHPDLEDLSFGSLGNEQGSLPPPMRPSTRPGSSDD
ncbi:hypothetical protein F5141DRAFT_1185419 [Pisolithus sp. B1]|nr:hypothetical protein F5141DRAFT_1185419 [Pisolithus sp. B1]